jgi:hypothetical protein
MDSPYNRLERRIMKPEVSKEHNEFMEEVSALLLKGKDKEIDCVVIARVPALKVKGNVINGGLSGTMEGILDLFDTIFTENPKLFQYLIEKEIRELMDYAAPSTNKIPC